MGHVRWTALVIACLFVYPIMVAVKADDDEVEDESSFTYNQKSENGPDNWANLNPTWEACGNGTLQSPIDLTDDRVVVLSRLGRLRRIYKPAPALIKNRGHDITVEWEGDAGGAMLNGTRYTLRQCHWHTPSEHTVDGKRLRMEIHMVHKNSLGHIAVIGILYKLGRPDTFLSQLLEKISRVNAEGMDAGIINPKDIKFGSRKYYRYVGSLTVPPCTEGVLWTIIKKVRTVSREQIRALREAVDDGFEDNSRPIQRSDVGVLMYRPKTNKH